MFTHKGESVPLVVDTGVNDSKYRRKELFGRRNIGFPTKRQVDDYRREMSTAPSHEVEAWANDAPPTIFDADMATEEEKLDIRRLLYTWKDLFVVTVRDMPATDLIAHEIPTLPHAKPRRDKMPLWTEAEKAYMRENLPSLTEAGVTAPCLSEWSTKPKFVPKKASGLLRLVNTYCYLNNMTIKDAYPTRRMEPILDSLSQSKMSVFMQADAANGYWAVPINLDDAAKTAFPTIYGQMCYLRMGQGLAGAPKTYTRLKDLTFGYVPGKSWNELPLSEVDPDVVCHYYMDDDFAAAPSVRKMIEFLHNHYFPRLSWARLTLSPSKCKFFRSEIEVLGFAVSADGMRPSKDKREVFDQYPVPTNETELQTFLWYLPWLSDSIPGRADIDTILKTAVRVERRLEKDDKGKSRRVKKDLGFCWTSECQLAFDRAIRAIRDHVMVGGDPSCQYHLAVDASGTGAGGVLIQLDGCPPGTDLFSVPMDKQRVVKCLSFKFSDVQRRYHNTEREFLALLLSLERCRHLLVGLPYPVMTYTDHSAIISIVNDSNNGRTRIVQWQYRLGEYNLQIRHVPAS